MRRAEEDLRGRFRQRVATTLEESWVRPANLPERVADRKLVEELLDPIVTRGFTNLGDLRDAASRGNLKLSDVASPAEFLHGDRLLQSDRALGQALDGVHRRGEVYLRWLQRFSALAFGTPAGRFLTLFLALPFGGSFVLLKGLEEIDELAIARFTHHHFHLVDPANMLVLGTVALGVINFARFRRGFLAVLGMLGRTVRSILVDLPARLFDLPAMRRLFASAPALAAWRFAIKPGLAALPFWLLAWAAGYGSTAAGAIGLTSFLAASLVFNTRAGRSLEERAVEGFSRAWRGLIFEVIPGLFHLIMSAFGRLIEWVEKLIYAVDEWLRFREGESRVVLASKAVLGLGWGVVAYAARVYLVLLVEPQINPIKHFPVVTVAAKIILPFAVELTGLFAAPLKPFLGAVIGNSVAATTVFFLPGVFGFLVWELRSNWRLYEGEPARFARADTRGEPRRDGRPVPPSGLSLGHVAEAVRPAAAHAAGRPRAGRCSSTARRCTTSRRRCADSSNASSPACSARADRSEDGRSSPDRSAWPPTASESSSSPATATGRASGSTWRNVLASSRPGSRNGAGSTT